MSDFTRVTLASAIPVSGKFLSRLASRNFAKPQPAEGLIG